MLAALVRAGFDARGLDVRPSSEFGELSDRVTTDAARFSDGLEVALTVVRDIAQTEAALFTEQSVLERSKSLKTLIICSTLSPRYLADLRTRVPGHIAMIDAPMSGAQIAAEEARLSFMLGGEDDDLDHLQPLFDAMGSHFHRMGGFGAGMTAKVLNNLLAASNTAMTRLVLDWADALGVEEERLLAVIATSSGQNWFASGFDDIEFARDGIDPDNTIGILVKDVESALDAAPEGKDQELPEAVIRALGNLSRLR